MNYKKCPKCELNDISDDEEFCSSCNPPISETKTTSSMSVETDFSSLRFGKNYGTNSQAIYEKFCDTLGWDKSQINKFGLSRPLYAVKADMNREYGVWFISHSNLTGTTANSRRTGKTANESPYRNMIHTDYSLMTENNSKSEAESDTTGEIRITFAKHMYGGYEFIGIYKLIKYEAYVKHYKRISDTYFPPIILCHIAWMEHYQGITGDDIPKEGGSHEPLGKSEIYNFKESDGKYYGFVEPPSSSKEKVINTQRICGHDYESVDNMLAVFIAPFHHDGKKKGGLSIVGFYRNATVYKDIQKRPINEKDVFAYNLICKAEDCFYIEPKERVTFDTTISRSTVAYGLDAVADKKWFLGYINQIMTNFDNDIKEIAEEQQDIEYQKQVDRVNDENLDINSFKDRHANEPEQVMKKSGMAVKRDPKLGKAVIKNSDYQCECNSCHESFVSQSSAQKYMEAHHFISTSKYKEVWAEFKINVDCVQNIVSLCPNCHRAIHYGTQAEKMERLEAIWRVKGSELKEANPNIEYKDILRILDIV